MMCTWLMARPACRPQMYKRRFAQWGFKKNSRHSPASTPAPKSQSRRVTCRKLGPTSLPSQPRFGHHEALVLNFLTSIRVCSIAFYESVDLPRNDPPPLWQQPESLSRETQDINLTFKLVSDLLDRGHGHLAGRMARKAFLLIEGILTLQAPARAWNLLEIMHHLVTRCHARLFNMLLAYLLALVDSRLPKTDPLHGILRLLRGLTISLSSTLSSPSSSLPASPISTTPSSSADIERTATTPESAALPALSILLKQAWVLNAELLFDRFDPRLCQLYFRVHLESCSVDPSAALISAASKWYTQLETGVVAENTFDDQDEALFEKRPFDVEKMHQRLLAPRMDASPSQTFNMLRTSSIAALRQHGYAIFGEGVGFSGDTTALLRILAGLVKVKLLEEAPPTTTKSSDSKDVRRIQAETVACAIKTVMELNPTTSCDGLGVLSDAVERLRCIVTLREYADGEIDARVVRDMWLLEDALVAAGEFDEAKEVQQEAFRRLEEYIWDIPVEYA